MGEEVYNSMAKYAFVKVADVVKIKDDEGKDVGRIKQEFRSLARSMPSMLQVNGLGAVTAFIYSKKSGSLSAHGRMYDLIQKWLEAKECVISVGKEDLMEQILNLDSETYRLYTNEIMNLCLWVKRFAEGMIESGKNNE